MLCTKCGCEMRIVSSFAQIVDGDVFIAHDLACANPKCSARSSLPSRRVLSRYNCTSVEGGVYCCGTALAYVSQDSYSTPDASAAVSCENGLLTLKCPLCGKQHEIDVAGKQLIEQ